MNRTLKEAPVLRYRNHRAVKRAPAAFLLACNRAKRLKTLRGPNSHEFVCARHQKDPAIVARTPTQFTLEPYS